MLAKPRICQIIFFLLLTLQLAYLASSLPLDDMKSESSSITGRVDSRSASTESKILMINFNKKFDGFMVINTTVRRILPFRRPGSTPRYIEYPVFLVLKVSGDQVTFTLPSNLTRFSIMGPFSKDYPLVPFKMFLAEEYSHDVPVVSFDWPVVYGFNVKLDILPLLDGSYPSFTVEAGNLSLPYSIPISLHYLQPNEQLALSYSVPELFFLASSFVLPPNLNVNLTVKASFKEHDKSFSKSFLTLANASLLLSELAEESLRVSGEELDSLVGNVSSLLITLKSEGYYLGGSENLLSQALGIFEKGGSKLQRASGMRLAYTLLQELSTYFLELSRGPGVVYTLSFAVSSLVLCMLLSWMIFEREVYRWFFALSSYVFLSLAAPLLLPRLRMEVEAIIALASVAGILWAGRALARMKLVQRLRTASGASLEGLTSSMANFSVSFLAKRRLRAVLLLVTSVSISFGVTCLSSFTMYSSVNQQTAGEVTSELPETYLILRGLSPVGPLNTAALSFLSGRSEVAWVAPSAIAIYPMNPVDTIQGLGISGIVGVSYGSPLADMLESILVEGSTSGLRSGSIIVSDTLAGIAGKSVGDTIEIRGTGYVIVGVFNSRSLNKMKDLDGEDVIPTVVMGMSALTAPPEGVVFMYYSDALLLGALTNKIYVKMTPGAETEELALALSLLGSVNVYVAERGKPLKVYYPGSRIAAVGSEVAVPSVIALLIVFSAFLGFTYEVRRDIFTLSTLGATPDQVFFVFVTLASVIGFAGGVLGYLLGMASFRVFNILDLKMPVDVKLDLLSQLLAILFSSLLALVGALIPASKAVVAVVPSLKRRWSPEAAEAERNESEREVTFITPIPVIIRSEVKAREFTDFVESKLVELANQKVSVYNVSRWEEVGDGGKSFVIYFEYLQVEGRAFKSYNRFYIKKVDNGYSVELESKIVSIYTMFAKDCLKDVASLVRKISLEWRAEEK
ncbi:MAG: ABC transporter permease [Thermofilaceae archaeon]|nr:ABC transporter permease [Thermofilaceae archaeon]